MMMMMMMMKYRQCLLVTKVCVFFAYSATNFYTTELLSMFRAHVHHTGRVRWWFGGVIDTSCYLDGTLFPFDTQSCSIIVQSWAYSSAFIDLRNASHAVHLDGFNDDRELTMSFVHSVGYSFDHYATVYSLLHTILMNKRQTAGLRADNYLLIVVTVNKNSPRRRDRPLSQKNSLH